MYFFLMNRIAASMCVCFFSLTDISSITQKARKENPLPIFPFILNAFPRISISSLVRQRRSLLDNDNPKVSDEY
jgi:hypothetical protein